MRDAKRCSDCCYSVVTTMTCFTSYYNNAHAEQEQSALDF